MSDESNLWVKMTQKADHNHGRLFVWLGCQDSNLGMSVPKTDALPLGDTPTTREPKFLRGGDHKHF